MLRVSPQSGSFRLVSSLWGLFISVAGVRGVAFGGSAGAGRGGSYRGFLWGSARPRRGLSPVKSSPFLPLSDPTAKGGFSPWPVGSSFAFAAAAFYSRSNNALLSNNLLNNNHNNGGSGGSWRKHKKALISAGFAAFGAVFWVRVKSAKVRVKSAKGQN